MTEERDEATDRARRRLMKLGAYLPAGVVALSAARAHAGRAEITAAVKTDTDSGVKVSFRSKGDWHVHTWAQSFGGGGHRNASGAYLNGTLDDIIHTVLTAAPSYLPLDESEADQEEDDSDLLQAFMNKQTHRAT